jgi:hypothetical protein
MPRSSAAGYFTKCFNLASLGENTVIQRRSFQCPISLFQELTRTVLGWLSAEGFNCQRLQMEDGGIVIQIEKAGGWRKVLGMSTAVHILFRQVENTVNVEIGNGRWLDKAAAGTLSLLILWPLAITAGIGAWQQMKLPERVFGYVAEYIGQSK